MADLASVAPMLKETWVPTFETAFSNEIVALSRIERTSDGVKMEVNARYVVIPLHIRRSQGIGSRPERGILPLPGKQGYVGTRVDLRTQYAVGEITAHALKLVDGDPRAAVDALDEELQGLKDDFIKDYARQVWGNSVGTLGNVDSISQPGGGDPDEIVVDSLLYFDVDMRLDAVRVTGGVASVVASNILVVGIDDDNLTLLVDDATGVQASDLLVRHGNLNQEINGFGVLVDDTAPVQNLDPANERRWKAHVLDTGSGHDYDDVELLRAFDLVRRSAGTAKEPTVIFTDLGVQRNIFSTLSADREFHNTVEFTSGYAALPFHRGGKVVPIVADVDFPDAGTGTGELVGVHEPSVKVFREDEGMHFAEETGSMFIAAQDRSDAWEFRLRQFSQLGIKQRNNHFRIKNINQESATP